MSYYRRMQEKIREEAMNFQCSEDNISYYELAEKLDYFYRYGKRFGLLKEFYREGII